MARRGQGINIPVSRVKVIKALEQALVKLETNYKKAHERWTKQVAKLALTKINKAEDLSAEERYNGVVTVRFNLPAGTIKLPEEPTREYETMHDWQYKESKEEIENTIRVLKMSDTDTINAATYGSITKYL